MARVSAGPDAGRPGSPIVQLRGVSLAGLPGKIDLTVQAGEFVTLTGPAKPGLSALLSVLGLLLQQAGGSYLLNGIDTAGMDDRDLATLRCREIGLVLQPSPLLPARSALANVMLPLLYSGLPARQRRNAALDCLARVGLAARAAEPAGALSAGERQQASIARALVTEPALLLLDDPTANLAAAGTAQLITLLTSLNAGGRTIIVATADPLAAAYGSRSAAIGQPRDNGPGEPPTGEHSTEVTVVR